MSTCSKTFKEPDNQNKSEATDEQISRWHKGESRFANSPQIHKGEQSQYRQAEQQGIRLQQRDRRNKSTDSRRYPNRDIQSIIDQESNGAQHPGVATQVFLGHGVGTGAVRIGSNCLAIAEIDNR